MQIVRRLVPGQSAELSGVIVPGDILTHVNGAPANVSAVSLIHRFSRHMSLYGLRASVCVCVCVCVFARMHATAFKDLGLIVCVVHAR